MNFKIPENAGSFRGVLEKRWGDFLFLHGFYGRNWDSLTGNGTPIAFQTRKFQGSLSPTKGDSEPRQTENLSDIFSIPRGYLRNGQIDNRGEVDPTASRHRGIFGGKCANLGRGSILRSAPASLNLSAFAKYRPPSKKALIRSLDFPRVRAVTGRSSAW